MLSRHQWWLLGVSTKSVGSKLRKSLFIQIVVLPLITLWDLGTSQAVLACGAAQVVGLRIPSLGSAGISA